MFVDTHVHLSHNRYAQDIADVVRRARENDVGMMFIPAIDLASIETALELCNEYEGLYAMVGLHPSYVKNSSVEDFDRVASLLFRPGIVAVGESGLDFYRDRSFDDKQRDMLRRHARLAIESDRPLILHNREASEDLVRILTEEREAAARELGRPARLRGIFHCFSGPASLGRQAIDLGFLLGIGGNVTYKNSPTAEAIREFDLADLVLETDGPFLAPEPWRGKRNEPARIPLVAEAVAAIQGVAVAEVAAATTANALSLFAVESGRNNRRSA